MPVEVTDDVYDLTVREAGAARYRVFLVDGDPPMLFDAAFADTTDVVADRLAEVGVDPDRLVITHGDPDHVGGLPGLAERYDLETWVPHGLDLDAGSADRRFGDGDDVGGFTAVHVPGHSPEHHALVDEARGVAVLGDAVFGSDARGLPAGHFVLPTDYFSADLGQADASLGALLDYEFDVGLVYHGSSVTSDASEKLERFVNFVGKPD